MNRGLINGIKQLFVPQSLGGGDPANDGALLGFDSTQPGGVKPVPSGTYAPATGSTVYAAKTQVSGLYVPLAAPVNKVSLGPGNIARAFTNLDLSANVPAGALAVVLNVMVRDTTLGVGMHVRVRQNGVTSGGINADGSAERVTVVTTSDYVTSMLTVGVDVNRLVQYAILARDNSVTGEAGQETYIDLVGYFAGPLA